MAKNKTISERIKIIDDKINELKKRIKPHSSSLQIKNVNDSIKKLEDQKEKLKKQAPSTNTSTTPTTTTKSTNKVVDAGQLKDFVVRPQLKRSVMKGKLPRHMIQSSRRVLTNDDANKAPKIRFSGSGKRSIMRGKIR
jgi:hypothetical protein